MNLDSPFIDEGLAPLIRHCRTGLRDAPGLGMGGGMVGIITHIPELRALLREMAETA